MEERRVKGKPVIYVPSGEIFIAEDGLRYKAVPDSAYGYACKVCDLWYLKGSCGRYRCVASDREDGVGVHFVRVKEENQKQ